MRQYAPYVSVPDFANLVSLSERTCWSLIRGELIPTIRVGRRTLIKTQDGFDALERLAATPANIPTGSSKPRGTRGGP